MVPVILGIIILLVIWLRWRFSNRNLLKLAEAMPGPPTLPLVGNALKFMGHPEAINEVLKDLILEYGDIFKFWLGTELNVVLSNLDDIKLLLSNPQMSIKGPQYKYMADFLGGGILSGSGAVWRKHRKIATPNYGKRAIENYTKVFNEEVDLLVKKLKVFDNNQRIDIYKLVVQTTSDVVCQTLMGLTKEETTTLPAYQNIILETPRFYDTIFTRMTKWYLQIEYIYWLTKYYKYHNIFQSYINDFSKAIIKHRQIKLATMNFQQEDKFNSKKDFLDNTQLSVIDRFLLSKEFDSSEILHETFTIFTSSQEASAKIASFILLMMAYYPTCQEKLYVEIKNVMGDKDKSVTSEELKLMPYLDMVFKEVLRLFPIAVMLQRTITEDIMISSCTLPAGCSLVIPVYHIHRDPRHWDNPDTFDPERFTPENVKARPANCYIPFSIGPMDCLGRYFGTKLVKTVVVKILKEFKVAATNHYKDMTVLFAISATTANGFPVILSKRMMRMSKRRE